jgi:hypothetical protein
MAKSSKRKKASRKAKKARRQQTMRPIDLDLSGGLEGQPPFRLPAAKSAQADVFEKSVVVTLYSQIEG